MSGWTTITLELRDSDEYYQLNNEHSVIEDAQDTLHNTDLQVFSTVTKSVHVDTDTGTNHQSLVIVIGGLYDWNENEALLEQLREYSTGRAVVIHANDTNNMGVARLYEHTAVNDWVVRDEFDEELRGCIAQTGMKAAAMMYAKHDIPAVSMTNPHSEFFERDDYSAETARQEPR